MLGVVAIEIDFPIESVGAYDIEKLFFAAFFFEAEISAHSCQCRYVNSNLIN